MKRIIYSAAISLSFCLTAFPQTATFPGLTGLGASTMTCVDRDGDGYGTGQLQVGPYSDLTATTGISAAVNTAPLYAKGGSGGTPGLQVVTFTDGGGSGATGNIAVNSLGVPSGYVVITNPGSGYTSVPTHGTVATVTGTVTFSGGALASVVNSASHTFVDNGDNFHALVVTGGSGWKPGSYTLQMVISGAGVLNGVAATSGATGGQYTLPGCLGPDADDLDVTVHSGAQAVAKYGSLNAFLAHLGYTPTRIWYVAPNGDDTKCSAGGRPAGINSPCLTVRPTLASLASGDAVLFRAGTYSGYNNIIAPITNGTSNRPIIFMAYPGESALLDMSGTAFPGAAIVDRSWLILDGLGFKGSATGCISGGNSQYGTATNTFHDITIRHVEASFCFWGIMIGGMDNVTIEDGSYHDNRLLGRQHGIYISPKGNLVSSNDSIRRVLVYNNDWSGIHLNGNMGNQIVEDTISYGNGISNLSFQNGTHNSIIRNNLSFQGGGLGWSAGGEPMEMSTYNGKEGLPQCASEGDSICRCGATPSMDSGCAHDQTGNLIENNTFYTTQFGRDGTATGHVALLVSPQNSLCTTPTCQSASLGNNTFHNNIFVANTDGSNHYVGIEFYRSADFTSSTFQNILGYQNDPAHKNGMVGVAPGAPYGYATYNCSTWASSFSNLSGKCINGDPKFTSADPTGTASVSSYNFSILPSSPALHSGSVGSTATDLLGNAFANPPSMGAIELASSTQASSASNAPTVSITAPAPGSTVSGNLTVSATASGSLSIAGVQFQIDGANVGVTVAAGPVYSASIDTTQYPGGAHILSAIATDSAGSAGIASVSVIINNVAATAPVISAVNSISVSSSSATINWTTSVAANSQVAYGTTAAYGSTTALAAALTTSHSVNLTGLSPSTTYHYQALSSDAQGNTATSADFTFATAASSTASSPSSSGGWQELPNTQLKSVCPANGFNGINYQFADRCSYVITAWSGAVADTKRNRLIIWGGGHVDYYGNEVYSLNLGANPATLTRLTDPSDFTRNPAGCPDTNTVDGTPVSRHTYNGIVYLPVQDKLFSFNGAPAPCGGPWSNRTYTLDLSQAVPKWQALDPIKGYNIGLQQTSAVCGYDPNTQTVICNSTGIFFRYDPGTNTNTLLSSGQNIPYTSTGVVDPKRKLFIFMGTPYQGTTPQVMALDLSTGSSFKLQNWSSQVSGCDGLAGANYPGLVYDPVLDRIVGWPNAGNTVYIFDTDQKTCTTQTFPNGPTNTLASTTGTFGRFQYFPGLNAYGLVSLATLDAFKLTLSATPPTQVLSCDINGDGVINSADVSAAINQALGVAPCGTAALQQTGQCTVVDVQRVINASLGGGCRTGQ